MSDARLTIDNLKCSQCHHPISCHTGTGMWLGRADSLSLENIYGESKGCVRACLNYVPANPAAYRRLRNYPYDGESNE